MLEQQRSRLEGKYVQDDLGVSIYLRGIFSFSSGRAIALSLTLALESTQ